MKYLRQPLTFTLTLTCLILLASAGAADQTTSFEYVVGPSASIAGTTTWGTICPYGCDLTGDGEDDYPLQHGPFHVDTPGSNVMVSADDDVWGHNVATMLCTYDPETGSTCFDPGCGSHAWLDVPTFGVNTVFVFAILVDDDFTVCGATTGTLTITTS